MFPTTTAEEEAAGEEEKRGGREDGDLVVPYLLRPKQVAVCPVCPVDECPSAYNEQPRECVETARGMCQALVQLLTRACDPRRGAGAAVRAAYEHLDSLDVDFNARGDDMPVVNPLYAHTLIHPAVRFAHMMMCSHATDPARYRRLWVLFAATGAAEQSVEFEMKIHEYMVLSGPGKQATVSDAEIMCAERYFCTFDGTRITNRDALSTVHAELVAALWSRKLHQLIETGSDCMGLFLASLGSKPVDLLRLVVPRMARLHLLHAALRLHRWQQLLLLVHVFFPGTLCEVVVRSAAELSAEACKGALGDALQAHNRLFNAFAEREKRRLGAAAQTSGVASVAENLVHAAKRLAVALINHAISPFPFLLDPAAQFDLQNPHDGGSVLFDVAVSGRTDTAFEVAQLFPGLLSLCSARGLNLFQAVLVYSHMGAGTVTAASLSDVLAATRAIVLDVWCRPRDRKPPALDWISRDKGVAGAAVQAAFLYLLARLAIHHNPAYLRTINQSLQSVPMQDQNAIAHLVLYSACNSNHPDNHAEYLAALRYPSADDSSRLRTQTEMAARWFSLDDGSALAGPFDESTTDFAEQTKLFMRVTLPARNAGGVDNRIEMPSPDENEAALERSRNFHEAIVADFLSLARRTLWIDPPLDAVVNAAFRERKPVLQQHRGVPYDDGGGDGDDYSAASPLLPVVPPPARNDVFFM